jgi:FkbM family methyltransferase
MKFDQAEFPSSKEWDAREAWVVCANRIYGRSVFPVEGQPDLPFVPDTVLDCGAGYGTWALSMRKHWPDAVIHAFEPVRECFLWLQVAVEVAADSKLNGWQIYQLALGNEHGKRRIGVPSYLVSSSFLGFDPDAPFAEVCEPDHWEEVDITTLDRWAAENSIEQVDLLKLDLQGFELEALRGAEDLLQRTRAIMCEVSTVQLYAGAPLQHEIDAHLAARGFKLYAMAHSEHPEVWNDALYLHE